MYCKAVSTPVCRRSSAGGCCCRMSLLQLKEVSRIFTAGIDHREQILTAYVNLVNLVVDKLGVGVSKVQSMDHSFDG